LFTIRTGPNIALGVIARAPDGYIERAGKLMAEFNSREITIWQ
jgi:hypothetical protein